MVKRALLCINRHARKGRQFFSQAVDELSNLEFELITPSANASQSVPELIHRYHHEVDMVIIGGGDGTLNAAADALVETQLPLAILPLGTANDLARTLGIPTTVPEACRAIATSEIRPIDLGCVNGKHFFNIASLGLGVEITENLSKSAKRRWGVLAYAMTALQVIGKTRPFHAEIRFDDQTVFVRTIQIAVGNGRYYGGGMAVAQDATIDDQRLDLYSLNLAHWWQLVPILLTMRKGEHTNLPWVQTHRAQEFEILTRKPHSINTDGELTTQTPARFKVVPNAISVLVPNVKKADLSQL
jgi:diacylglycerol kinase (ATP)